MDKYEYKVRSEEIKELIAQKEYVQAAEIADTIDWRRVKSVMMLCTISDLYKINRRYDDSHDLLLLAYDRHPGGRTIVYALCELSIKMGNVTQAWEYYKEYMQIAPKDPGRYILQYKIYEAEEVNLEERIAVLEELKKRDYRERWAYELAYLYHRIGLASKCVDECDEMIVWFGDGKYVIKALELKMLHQPLTLEQQIKYDNRFASQEEELVPVEEVYEQVEEESVSEATATWSGTQVSGTEGLAESEFATTKRVPVEEIDIQVKTMDPSQCNTINLQEEVAAGLRQLWEDESQQAQMQDGQEGPLQQTENKSQNEKITRAIIAPMLETDNMDRQAVEDALAEESGLMQSAEQEMEEAYVTEPEQEVPQSVQRGTESYVATSEQEAAVPMQEQAEAVKQADSVESEPKTMETAGGTNEDVDHTAVTVMEQLRQERTAEPPKEMAQVLSMEADGQISLVMPEKEAIEKQITGQISIADIMAEWERRKKEIEEKNKEKILQNVKRDTGPMFTEFEAAIRDGLLGQLEQGRDVESVIAQAEGRSVDEDGIPIPPSLLETESAEAFEEGFVEDYEAISPEEAREAVEPIVEEVYVEEASQESVEEAYVEETPQESVEETYVEEVPQESVEEAYVEETSQESVEEAYVEEAPQEFVEEVYAEEAPQESVEEAYVEEAPQEFVEEAYVEEVPQESVEKTYVEETPQESVEEAYVEEAPQESVEKTYVEETLQESVEEAYVEEVPQESMEEEYVEDADIDRLVESVLREEDEVEELVEIEDYPEEAVEESGASFSEIDAAYESALVGATEDVTGNQEAGIDYETISMPTGEVEAVMQQEEVKLRNLTREERELFSPYIQGRSSKVQLVQTIDNISMAAYTGNVVITGAEGLDTMGLAKNMIRNIQLTDSNFSGKIAKISGESLNKRDVISVLEGLDNGALIIQRAGAMNTKTADALHKALQQEHRGIVVILEGTRKAMNAFLEKNTKLQACFTGRIDMEALSDAALVAFGKKYAREKEYSIDELGDLALSRKIAERQTSDHAVTIMEVKEIIDEAIESANRKTLGHFFDLLMAKRYDEEDMIIIREKDFR